MPTTTDSLPPLTETSLAAVTGGFVNHPVFVAGVNGAVDGMLLGAALGTVVPAVGTAGGMALGAAAGFAAGCLR